MRLIFVDPRTGNRFEGEFSPGEVTVWEAARRLGAPLRIPCGGQGLCGKCAVHLAPAPPPSAEEERLLGRERVAAGERLACRCRPKEEAVIRGEAPAPLSPAGLFPDAVPVEPGRSGLGLALDLGTTTLAAGCVDLTNGRVVSAAQAANPQARHGEDVLARLGYALRGAEAREELRRAVVEGLNRLIAEVAGGAGVNPEELRQAVIVGNPAMHHLLLGLPIDSLAVAPHRPSAVDPREERAGELGLALEGSAPVYLPPLIDGFVGSDALAVGLAEGLLPRAPAGAFRLALDLGTNGEVLLATPAGVYACSTAAGPAFEGGGLRCGMRAETGAVVAVWPGRPFAVETVGGAAARGLAGSGALGAAAALLALGVLGPTGRLRDKEELSGPPWPGLAERLVTLDGGMRAVELVSGEEADGGPVVLTQSDIRQLQLAKGAIRAAVEALRARAGAGAGDLSEILLGGAFGHGLAPESALATGLLPPVPAGRLRTVGNVAWKGAALLLGCPSRRPEAERAARRIGHITLADDPHFPSLYMSALDFPQLEGVPKRQA